MRDKLHNCKYCMWQDKCADKSNNKIHCKYFYNTQDDGQEFNEYNQSLRERQDDSLDIIKEMCDEFFDSFEYERSCISGYNNCLMYYDGLYNKGGDL